MKNIKELVADYMDAFAKKDKQRLSELYAEDFSLRDWLSEAHGKEKVLELNQKFYDNYPGFSFKVVSVYVDGNVACCELEVKIDDPMEGEQNLKIVDVIEFSEDGKMEKLRAYFG
jgi:ketosteroid isomerase-like protein